MAASAESANGIHDATLSGNWIHQSYDGIFTQLEIEQNGKFTFREVHSRDLRRAYMCGNLADGGDVLNLRVKQQKERDISGIISQASGESKLKFDVRSRGDKRLVIDVDGRTVVLERS